MTSSTPSAVAPAVQTAPARVASDSSPRGVWLAEALTQGPGLAARYAALVEQIPAVFYIDLPDDDDTTLYVSPQVEAVLGIDPDHYVNSESNPWEDNLHPEDRAAAVAEYQRLLAAGGGEHEYRIVRPDTGAVVWVQDRFVLLGEGEEAIVQGVMLDVTREREDAQTIAQQLQMITRAEEVGREFTRLVADRADVNRVIHALSTIVGNPVLLEDTGERVAAHDDAGLDPDEVLDFLARHRHSEAHTDSTPEDDTTAHREGCVWQDVMVRDERWGRLHVLPMVRPVDRIDQIAVDRAVAALELVQLIERDSGNLAESARGSLVSDLVHGRLTSGVEFVRRSRSLGIDLSRGDLAVVVVQPLVALPRGERERQTARTRLLRRVRAMFGAAGIRALSALEGERVVAVLSVDADTDLKAQAQALADPQHAVGVSAVVEPPRLSRAVEQAQEAVRHAAAQLEPTHSGVLHFEDLGLRHLLGRLAEGPDLARFVDVELGRLLAHDEEHGATLLPTLRSFLAEHGSKSNAARALGVERRTVYYRLERIATLLGRDLDDHETRLRLEVALRGLDLLRAPVTPVD